MSLSNKFNVNVKVTCLLRIQYIDKVSFLLYYGMIVISLSLIFGRGDLVDNSVTKTRGFGGKICENVTTPTRRFLTERKNNRRRTINSCYFP